MSVMLLAFTVAVNEWKVEDAGLFRWDIGISIVISVAGIYIQR